ncbi:MAG TPA: hypothetical protein P5114_10035, partial [Hyphomicrobiaceae bacterium]|nr:hypothetical protein [Hyphomicrobiaceae bacterium]
LEHFPTKWIPVRRRKSDHTKELEHFPTKWIPVRRRKSDHTKELERRFRSIGSKSALGARVWRCKQGIAAYAKVMFRTSP